MLQKTKNDVLFICRNTLKWRNKHKLSRCNINLAQLAIAQACTCGRIGSYNGDEFPPAVPANHYYVSQRSSFPLFKASLWALHFVQFESKCDLAAGGNPVKSPHSDESASKEHSRSSNPQWRELCLGANLSGPVSRNSRGGGPPAWNPTTSVLSKSNHERCGRNSLYIRC